MRTAWIFELAPSSSAALLRARLARLERTAASSLLRCGHVSYWNGRPRALASVTYRNGRHSGLYVMCSQVSPRVAFASNPPKSTMAPRVLSKVSA